MTAVASIYSRDTQDFVQTTDPEIAKVLEQELERQQNQLEMIASENFTSRAVLAAQGSVLTNKYAEGYPGRRYYNGCEIVDIAETLAIERACKLFDCAYANVQPHSGSQANIEVFMALIKPGDTFLGMDLASGGHLTHGSHVNFSGKWFNAVGYGLRESDHCIDMDQVEALAREHKPKLIIAGGSAYPRNIDFARFRKIADEAGAYFWVDMAHFAGLVAGKQLDNPLKYAHVVTTTTHKTLRGPRGGMILSDCPDLAKQLNSAVFPGSQGGPLMHAIAGKAVAFKEALQPDFEIYAAAVIANAKILAKTLKEGGLEIVSGGTDCHLILVDLRPFNINGRDGANALERAGITCNKNSVYNDPRSPQETSGLRLGSPALTTRGMGEKEFIWIAEAILEVLRGVRDGDSATAEKKVRDEISDLCARFPLYDNF
ncbi:MAG: serine hydroxymethyltransferase [Alphaproteobacteria bacterium]|nr:serine hydroxymethyltransferase [Alphaproteobacteria bacterium]NCQ67073.1 serine hydroxymethyltransferase [Alphaproteobacteria bacterium]NCT07670.1 serine hydroxymethyltransferase [Alphaproteobacteria bacterium]